MGAIYVKLDQKYEEKLRKLAEKHKRTLKAEIQHGIDLIEKQEKQEN